MAPGPVLEKYRGIPCDIRRLLEKLPLIKDGEKYLAALPEGCRQVESHREIFSGQMEYPDIEGRISRERLFGPKDRVDQISIIWSHLEKRMLDRGLVPLNANFYMYHLRNKVVIREWYQGTVIYPGTTFVDSEGRFFPALSHCPPDDSLPGYSKDVCNWREQKIYLQKDWQRHHYVACLRL